MVELGGGHGGSFLVRARVNPEFAPQQLKKTRPLEYLVRFAFGGLVSVAAHLVAARYGPALGGFFLAFPAILPASLTLVKEHDGRSAAEEDARGAAAGSVGMVAFGSVVWITGEADSPTLTLLLAVLVWGVVSVVIWSLLLRKKPPRGTRVAASSRHEQQIRT